MRILLFLADAQKVVLELVHVHIYRKQVKAAIVYIITLDQRQVVLVEEGQAFINTYRSSRPWQRFFNFLLLYSLQFDWLLFLLRLNHFHWKHEFGASVYAIRGNIYGPLIIVDYFLAYVEPDACTFEIDVCRLLQLPEQFEKFAHFLLTNALSIINDMHDKHLWWLVVGGPHFDTPAIWEF